jgi:hypothetical protein
MKSQDQEAKLVLLKYLHYHADFKISEKMCEGINDDFNTIEMLIQRIKRCNEAKGHRHNRYEVYPEMMQYILRQRDLMMHRHELGTFLDLYLKQVQLFWYELRLL